MARSVQDTKLDSRNARDRLKPRARPYYTTLIPGELHIGYRRRRKGKGAQGRWLVRRYMGKDAKGVGRYQEKDIGLADDFLDADGHTILDFKHAQKLANEWRRDNGGGGPSPSGPLTVGAVLDRYFAYLEDEDRPTADARLRANLHILPSLGSELVDTLNSEGLRSWLADMAKQPPRLRQKADATAPRYRMATEEDDKAENKRRRKSTANRVLTILKAALNHAFEEGKVKSNREWGKRLKPFKKVDAARQRFLTFAEAKRLVNASEPDLRNLVMAGLSTGARFGELARLKVSDFDTGTVAVWQSKSGEARHVYLTDEGVAFFKQLTAGRAGSEVMLRKADGTAWQKSEQSRPMAAAVKRAKISPPISFHGLRHTYASLAIMAATPLQVVATNLGHTDTRMVEKHYGHLTDSYLKDEIRKGAPTFDFPKGGKVVALDKKGAAR
jgi:integrase